MVALLSSITRYKAFKKNADKVVAVIKRANVESTKLPYFFPPWAQKASTYFKAGAATHA